MISTHLFCVIWPNYPETNVVGAAVDVNYRKRKENLSLRLDIFHKTFNGVISRCCFVEDGKKYVLRCIIHVQSQCFDN